MALNIYHQSALSDPLDDLKHLLRPLRGEHRDLFKQLVREHGPMATYIIPSKSKIVGNTAKMQFKTRTFRTMTHEECRAVLDMMLGKQKRDAESAALAAEQEAIANATYRNPNHDLYDPLRVAKEKLGIKP